MNKSGTIQFKWYYRTVTTNRCLGFTTQAFFSVENKMFKRVHAEPNGEVTFEYGDSTVTINKDGVSQIRSTIFSKGKYGPVDNIRNSSVKHISDQLSEHIQTSS